MAALPARLILATFTGLMLTGSFAGVSLSLSYIAVPSLLVSAPNSSEPKAKPSSNLTLVTTSDHLARQYQRVFDLGAATGPVVGVLSTSTFIYAYRSVPVAATVPRSLFIAAAVLNIAVAPFTVVVMKNANGELQRRSAEASAGRDETQGRKEAKAGTVQSYDTPRLIEWWSFLNALRGWIQLGAFACATIALVSL
jgi:Domain of unknown function (DUF1772)